MLGRQQIAGIPTAVSEIFKNAYDAYATSVRGDYFPDRRILMIRDNGVGMSREDFETRWLTVGTDSKAAGSPLPQIPRPSNVPIRRQMGEKGIGRLAIATLAPQLLVVSRPLRNIGTPSDRTVLAFVQWTLFEVPGLTLEDVVVPIRDLARIDDVDERVVASIREEFTKAFHKLGGKVPEDYRDRINSELEYLNFDPRAYLRLNGPKISDTGGSAFILSAVSDDIEAAMETGEAKADEFAVSEFQRFLLGFTNTIVPAPTTPKFTTEFIRHESSGLVDVIDPGSYFWENEDFGHTDHTVEGKFDEYGAFTGRLSIYGQEPIDIVERWSGSKGNRSACGPFTIKFGYVQGQQSDSRLPGEEFVRMTARLDKLGGLYVYRDGIRVLPYGNSDYDYLEIEKRRSLNAGTYYFSYRRMFGAIDIDSRRNPQLQEKAGREGFRENRGYRDFRDILKGFLIQLAADYFSRSADTSEAWRTERDRLKSRSAARAQREKAEKLARERFAHALLNRIHYIDSGRFVSDVQRCVERVEERLLMAYEGGSPPDLIVIEDESTRELRRLKDLIGLTRPEDLPLSREEDRDWRSYQNLKTFAEDQLSAAATSIEAQLENARRQVAGLEVSRREIEERRTRLETISVDSHQQLAQLAARVEEQSNAIGEQMANAARRSLADFDGEIGRLLRDVNDLGFAEELRLTTELTDVASAYAGALEQLLLQAQAVSESEDLLRENVILKEEILDLREQVDSNLELLQLGQAVQIVSHEFEASIRSVRNGLRTLTPWATATPRLQPVVRDLRAAFAHLDGYLRLFTPLQRRLYREAVLISGEEVESFLRGVFSERLERHRVELTASDSFRSWTFEGYPSTFYPVFVNLVDNAIYWVTSESRVGGTITLDADGDEVLISDTGPGVRPRDREVIFDRGFSRRRGGRGLGLSLARELLERDGWTLELVDIAEGAGFRIAQRSEGES